MNRRQFFRGAAGGVAGMLVVDAGTRNAAAATLQNGPIIDFHSHCSIAGVAEMMGRTSRTGPTTIGPDRLVAMDELGIDIEVLSINPNLYDLDEAWPKGWGRVQNEGIAEICAGYDGRFVGLATLALQYPELAVEQLEEGVNELGLRGGSIGSSVGSEQLGDPKFDPSGPRPRSWTCPSGSIRRLFRNCSPGCKETECWATRLEMRLRRRLGLDT